MYFFYGENISFDSRLVIYKNSTNISPIMIINRIYEFLISSLSFLRVVNVVQFLLGNSPASVCYWPTFWNALSVPSS
jgi:hypothetical protein